ncbi:hypothetical protein SAMN02927903_03057 [Flavobacterium caeni]|uniref:Uncharacterized protein n=2 Tax=Flavobacterium caeni TaxID=490189 RepID=A0A1G5K2D1_9FLAO|nr:hypothetical protein SAMN02927903_03057 [Flavobacterium caeni]
MILAKKAEAVELNALQVLTTAETGLSGADSTSKVAIWRLIVWIVAFCIWLHEQVVTKNADNSRPLNRPNFISMVLNFHDGLPLKWIDGLFQYDLSTVPNPDTLKIINRCALLEGNGQIVVKVAHDNNGTLEPIADAAAIRLKDYIVSQIQPGPEIVVVNKSADLLKTALRVYVDPQMIDLITGEKLPSGSGIFPVDAAITEYLTGLTKAELNGAFVVNKFKQTIEAKDGIDLVEIDLLQWSFDAAPFADFTEWKVPESGYFRLDSVNLTKTFLPYVLVNA